MDIEAEIRQMHAAGKSRTLAADLLGVSRAKLDTLSDYLGITWTAGRAVKQMTINGVSDTVKGHAQRLGLSVKAFRERINSGLSLTKPPIRACTKAEARKFMRLRARGKSVEDAAAAVGRPYNTLRLAALNFFPDEYKKLVSESKRVRKKTRNKQPKFCKAAKA